MNHKAFLQELDRSESELESLLAGLEDDDFVAPPIRDGWRLKDLLAHLNRWRGEAVTLLFQLENGSTPGHLVSSEQEADRLNAQWLEEDHDRNLKLILADLRGLDKQIRRRVAALSDVDLESSGRFPGLGDAPLWRHLAENTFEHTDEHIEEIRAWRERL